MQYRKIGNLDVSVFTLGTVQLGIEYGLGEHSAKPTEEAAFAILDRAVDMGVNTLDTANNYGDSEAVIGRWLTKRRAEGKKLPYIVTKVGPLKHGSYDILRDDVMYQLEGCMKRLCIDKLDIFMLHDFEDYNQDRDALQKISQDSFMIYPSPESDACGTDTSYTGVRTENASRRRSLRSLPTQNPHAIRQIH